MTVQRSTIDRRVPRHRKFTPSPQVRVTSPKSAGVPVDYLPNRTEPQSHERHASQTQFIATGGSL
jgi:hypothetical protein